MQTAPSTSAGAPDAAAILAPLVAPMAARARAFMDTNRTSATYGCADRPYWYYRTLTNFSGSTWQQVMLGLAALYKTQHASNPCAGDPAILEMASASLMYWSKLAHGDGAFDEWYLNEFSYCPTAITGAGAAQALDLIGGDLAPDVRQSASEALCRTASWLDKRYNPTVMNQNLAAAVALAGAAKIDPKWKAAAEAKFARVRKDQSPEGWFPEYSGADLGYSTLALDLLAGYHRLTASPDALAMAKALTAWMAATQGGWRTLAGRVGSRGTSHVFPHGALYFADHDENATRLAQDWLVALQSGAAPHPGAVDDRYFAYFYFPEFALAYHRAAEMRTVPASTPAARPGLIDQPGSGLIIIRKPSFSALISRRLGGALAIDAAGAGAFYHLGYEIETTGGRFSSANWDEDIAFGSTAGPEIVAQSEFRASSSGVPLKTLMAPFQLVVGFLATSSLAEGFQGVIKKKMIAPKKAPGLRLERRITMTDRGLDIEDRLTPGPGLLAIKRLDVARTISMHSPSARQDTARNTELPAAVLQTAAADLNAGRQTTLSFAIDGSTGAVSMGQGR